MKDFNGTTIKVGQKCLMAFNKYDSAQLMNGTIKAIKPFGKETKNTVFVQPDSSLDGSTKRTREPHLQIIIL